MILSIDTATPHLVVGLVGDDVTREHVERVERAHAERLATTVERVLGPERTRLTAIVVGTGPGSYTGLRVGASYAMGLGLAFAVPVLGVPTLEAIAARREGQVAVTLDARKGQVYGAVYEIREGQVVDTLNAPEKLPIDVFADRASGLVWLRDEAPGGIALARLGPSRGREDWTLTYA